MAGVLRDKLAVPLVPWFAIERVHLEQRLDLARHNRLVLVRAPTGFGKSVLAAQYARKQTRVAVGWLRLDTGDNDARRLATHLVAALGGEGTDFGASSLERLTAGPAGLGVEFVQELAAELRHIDPLLLVLDELEAITDQDIRTDLLNLLRSAPRQVHVVAITRSDPDVPLHRLRLIDELVEIGPEDLAFDASDARTLIQRVCGRDLTYAQAATLWRRTEGWPAGLQAAGLALREADALDLDATIEAFGATDDTVERHLAEEVLAGLEAPVEDFLLATSVLPRLNGTLCDAVTGDAGGAAMLERLHGEALFVVRADGDAAWYRYHGLFRGVLRNRRHRTDPRAERDGLVRAAAWHLERGEVDDAVPFLVEAEDWDQVIDLVRIHGGAYLRSGRAATLLGWLDAVPESVRSTDPMLSIEHASLCSLAGDSLVAEADLAAVDGSPLLTGGHRLVAASIKACWVEYHAPPETVIDWCNEALRSLPDVEDGLPDVFGISTPGSLEGTLHTCWGRALLYQGELDLGRAKLLDLEHRLLREERFGHSLVNVLGSIAMVDAWTGRLRNSEDRYHRAMRHVTAIGPASHDSAAHAHLAMGQVLLDQDETAGAEVLLTEASGFADQTRRPMPIILHAILRCRLSLAMNEPDRGLDEFDRLRSQGFAPFPPAIATRTLAVHLQLLLAAGQGNKAVRLFEGRADLISGPMVGAAAAVLVKAGDLDRARRVLESSALGQGDDRTTMERDLWLAVLVADDDPDRAERLLEDVLGRAELEGHVRLFLDGGSPVLRLLRQQFERQPSPFLRRLVASGTAPASPSAAANRSLIDPLSERELVVLGFLATRLSNHEIAERLLVSVNTLKTHLRHVYAKLGVNDRRSALKEAEAAGLI